MAFTSSVQIKGGAKMRAVLDRAEKAKSARKKQIKVGFFSDAEYPDGTKVAAVAAINEYGLGDNPERPFFRQSIAELEKGLPKELRGIIDPQTMTVSAADADRIGSFAVSIIRGRIQDLKDPPNAASTVILKRGKSNPLVDTGEMRDAVGWEAE